MILNRALALALTIAAALGGGCAHADVLEIGADGAVVTYSRPTVHTLDSVKPIIPVTPPQSPAISVQETLNQAATRYALDPALLQAVAWQESRFRPSARSPKGAVGVMQLMPATARQLGVNPLDLEQNIHGGADYLSRMLRRYGGDVRLGLAAYNAGPGAVDRHRGVPPFTETQGYVAAVLARLGATR